MNLKKVYILIGKTKNNVKTGKEHIDVWNQGLQNIKNKFSDYTPSIFKDTQYTVSL